MSPRKIKNKAVASHEWSLYLKKGRDFRSLAQKALADQNWNGAGLASVHMIISVTDALLAFKAGIRSASERHMDLYFLLQQKADHPETKQYANRLMEILDQKNVIEYESRSFTENEAQDCFKKSERYFSWVCAQLP